jgi:hypothetical protein
VDPHVSETEARRGGEPVHGPIHQWNKPSRRAPARGAHQPEVQREDVGRAGPTRQRPDQLIGTHVDYMVWLTRGVALSTLICSWAGGQEVAMGQTTFGLGRGKPFLLFLLFSYFSFHLRFQTQISSNLSYQFKYTCCKTRDPT